MLELYKKRMHQNGSNVSDALKSQSNNMMNHTFKNGTSYRNAIINEEFVDVRFFSNSSNSIKSDPVDYKLQFRPHIKYPLGTYVSIPNDENEYEDWILVGKSDDTMFQKYNILRCNYLLRWIYDYKVYEYKVALREKQGGASSGLSSNDFLVTLDNQIAIWLPTTDDVNRLSYGSRFLITYNEYNPVSYKVTKSDDVLNKGITRLALVQDEKSVYDNFELKIADYYKYFPNKDTEKEYILVGENYIRTNTNAQYGVQDLLGEKIKEVSYSITDKFGLETDLATIENIDGKCLIKSSGATGVILLSADIDGIVVTKEIRIKGLL